MKIVLVPGQNIVPALGGQGSFCRYLAEGLADLGHEITIVGEPGWSEFCRAPGVEFSGRLSPGLLRAADVVHVNGPGRQAALLARVLGRPLLVTHQDYSYLCPAATAWTPAGCATNSHPGPCAQCPRQGFRARAGVGTLRGLCRQGANVAVSRSLHERLQIPGSSWILSPIRSCPAADSVTDGPLLFAGRLAPEKGIDLLLQAAARLPEARLEIAGDGPLRADLESLAGSLHIAERVRFHGWLGPDRLDRLRHRAAVVCVPSLWPEPFGYAAAEAMASGLPVVATGSGSFRELLGDDRGWLCPPGVEAWTAGLAEALADPAERKRRAERALGFVRSELDPLIVAGRYFHIYEHAAGR